MTPTTTIYDIVYHWLYAHDLEVMDLPKGGYLERAVEYLLVYDKDGQFDRYVVMSLDAVVNLMMENGI